MEYTNNLNETFTTIPLLSSTLSHEVNFTEMWLNHSSDLASSTQANCQTFNMIVNTGIIGVLCILGFIGNTVSILVLRKDQNNKVAVFLLQALGVADNSILLVSFFMLVLFSGLQPDVSQYALQAEPYLRKYFNPMGYIIHNSAVWLTVLLAINRYIAVCKPFIAPSLLTVRRAKIQVFLVILGSTVFNVPRFFQYTIVRNGTKTKAVPTNIGEHSTFGIIYSNALYTIFVLVIPFCTLVTLNFNIIKDIRISRRKMRKNSLQGSEQRPKGENITMVMIIIVIIFLVCHTPDRILQTAKAYYLNQVYKDPSKEPVCPSTMWYALRICNLLIVLNSSTNFIVYYFCRPHFRLTLSNKICSWRNKESGNGDMEQTGISLLQANGNGVNGNLKV